MFDVATRHSMAQGHPAGIARKMAIEILDRPIELPTVDELG
jgi:hypothetical protein